MPNLTARLLEISKKHDLAHIGSCMTALPLIEAIYQTKAKNEPFILSNGHAGLALYVVLEKMYGIDAEEFLVNRSIHATRDITKVKDLVWASTGSLGHGLPIGLGMALADRTRNVHVLTSDGEWAEGSIWESLNIMAEQEVDNLYIHVNANGYGAFRKIDVHSLEHTIMSHLPMHLTGNVHVYLTHHIMNVHNDQSAHYFKPTDEEFKELLK